MCRSQNECVGCELPTQNQSMAHAPRADRMTHGVLRTLVGLVKSSLLRRSWPSGSTVAALMLHVASDLCMAALKGQKNGQFFSVGIFTDSFLPSVFFIVSSSTVGFFHRHFSPSGFDLQFFPPPFLLSFFFFYRFFTVRFFTVGFFLPSGFFTASFFTVSLFTFSVFFFCQFF